MTKKFKYGIFAALIATLMCGLVLGQTFNFYFDQTKYEPEQYVWDEPWTVEVAIDFIDVALTVTGPGYQDTLHDYVLDFTNVAPTPEQYILNSFDYAVKWIVDVEEEILVQGTFSDILFVGESVQYSGTFIPLLAGSGDITMDVGNIVWIEAETINWSYEIIDTVPLQPDYLTVESFAIVGATETYLEDGQVEIEFSTPGPGSYVTFDLTLPEVGTVNFDFQMTTGDHDLFTYSFGALTTGGDLTATLTLITQHS